MRLTLALSPADVESLLASFLPLHIRSTEGGERYFVIGPAKSFALVAGAGVRVETSARIHWEALGIGLPLTVRSVRVLFRPHIDESGEALLFGLSIEEADFVGVPGFVDQAIAEKLNSALSSSRLAWNFAKTLRRAVPLPAAMSPVHEVQFHVSGAEVALGSDGLALSADVTASVSRDRPAP